MLLDSVEAGGLSSSPPVPAALSPRQMGKRLHLPLYFIYILLSQLAFQGVGAAGKPCWWSPLFVPRVKATNSHTGHPFPRVLLLCSVGTGGWLWEALPCTLTLAEVPEARLGPPAHCPQGTRVGQWALTPASQESLNVQGATGSPCPDSSAFKSCFPGPRGSRTLRRAWQWWQSCPGQSGQHSDLKGRAPRASLGHAGLAQNPATPSLSRILSSRTFSPGPRVGHTSFRSGWQPVVLPKAGEQASCCPWLFLVGIA